MKLKLAAAGALGAFLLSGPLQHVGALPQTAIGDASKALIKMALNVSSTPAFASCGGFGGPQGNNGFGNGGGDGVPGHSGFPDNNR
ncbi:MAG: hypothetical protein ACM30H_13180 [Clostridia bacterium]